MNTVKPDDIALFCLTPGGVVLAKRLSAALPMTCMTRDALVEEGFVPFDGSFAHSVQQAFTRHSALIFIGATGIAVRVLAPLLVDKFHDPAVVYKATWPESQTVRGTLADIADKVRDAGIRKTALILVGNFLGDEYHYSRLYAADFSHEYRKA